MPEQHYASVTNAFTESIQRFHERFGIPETKEGDWSETCDRYNMMASEFLEANAEIHLESWSRYAHEIADVAYVALGILYLMGETGLNAIQEVTTKNNAKNWTTHEMRPSDGKLVRRQK